MKHLIQEIDLQRTITEQLTNHGWVDRSVAGYDRIIDAETLNQALHRINPKLHRDDHRSIQRWIESGTDLHAAIVNGVTITRNRKRIPVRLVDYDDVHANTFHIIQEITMEHANLKRRADAILAINGIPIAIIELKSPSRDEEALISAAAQLIHYQNEFPTALHPSLMSIVSDGIHVWLAGNQPRIASDFNIMDVGFHEFFGAEGPLTPKNILELTRKYVLSDHKGATIIAAPHQQNAIERIENAITQPTDDPRIGVIWHSQGTGKSVTILLTAIAALRHTQPNPLVLIITDRTHLEEQLHRQFTQYAHLIPGDIHICNSTRDIHSLTHATGIAFCVIQKFNPNDPNPLHCISERRNITIIADEAHRSHVPHNQATETNDTHRGYHHALRTAFPNAKLVGFTATPIHDTDHGTLDTFGRVLHEFTHDESVRKGFTLPINIHTQPITINAKHHALHQLQTTIDTLHLHQRERNKFEETWSTIAAVMLTQERIQQVAQRIVTEHEHRTQQGHGKALVFCMNRHHCILIHDAIKKLRPDWYHPEDHKGRMKVVITGKTGEPQHLAEHSRNSNRRTDILEQAKHPNSPIDLIINCDLLTTGYDAPIFDTIYNDKIMRGATLLQAFTRINRKYPNKTHGDVFDFAGITRYLNEALVTHHGIREIAFTHELETAFAANLNAIAELLPNHEPILESAVALLQFVEHSTRQLAALDRAPQYLKLVDELQYRYRRAPRLPIAQRNIARIRLYVTIANTLARLTPQDYVRLTRNAAVVRGQLDDAFTATSLKGATIAFAGMTVAPHETAGVTIVTPSSAVQHSTQPYLERVQQSIESYNRNVLALRVPVLKPNIPNVHRLRRFPHAA